MTSRPSTVLAEKRKAIESLNPSWLPLYHFLLTASRPRLVDFCKNAPAAQEFWVQEDEENHDCGDYAFQVVLNTKEQVLVDYFSKKNTISLKEQWLRAHPDMTFQNLLEQQLDLAAKLISIQNTAPTHRLTLDARDRKDIRNDLERITESGYHKIIDRPEDLEPGHYLATYGFINMPPLGQIFHYARLGQDGHWSHKKFSLPVQHTGKRDPFEISRDFTPVYFLSIPSPELLGSQ